MDQGYDIALQLAINQAVASIYEDDILLLIEFDGQNDRPERQVVALDNSVIDSLSFEATGLHLLLHTGRLSQTLHMHLGYNQIIQIVCYWDNMNFKQVVFDRSKTAEYS